MSDQHDLGGASIAPESPLGQVLGGYDAPALSSGFADRVLAATKSRPDPLPELRGDRRARSGRWRMARRAAIATLAAGALGTAAAATGVLDNLPIELPSAQEVWTTLTGQEPSPAAITPVVPQVRDGPAESATAVEIEGPIDTPEELEEAFRRVDRVREDRREIRRGNVDRRIDRRIESRREQGLPAPTPEQEDRLKKRIDQFRERRDERVEQRIEERRDGMREQIENGDELSREDFIRQQRRPAGEASFRERMRQFRELSPEERRERLKRLRERRFDRMPQDGEQALPSDTDAIEASPGDQVTKEGQAPEQIEPPSNQSEDLSNF